MKLPKKLVSRWHKIPEVKRTIILERLGTILNYLGNGILLSIPLQIFLFLFYDFSWKNYYLLVISISILLAFFEHYYRFLRSDWKKEL
jgi:hypothetical protein